MKPTFTLLIAFSTLLISCGTSKNITRNTTQQLHTNVEKTDTLGRARKAANQEQTQQTLEEDLDKFTGNREFRAKVLSTNFNIPVIRFNFLDDKNLTPERKGNVSFFNSIGAGVGFHIGRLTESRDTDEKLIHTEMDNIVGVQIGFLFASNSSNTNNSNIFALTTGVSILNFQLGYGYELGTVSENEKRGFLTLAYGIPLNKLVKGGSYIISKKSMSTASNPESRFF